MEQGQGDGRRSNTQGRGRPVNARRYLDEGRVFDAGWVLNAGRALNEGRAVAQVVQADAWAGPGELNARAASRVPREPALGVADRVAGDEAIPAAPAAEVGGRHDLGRGPADGGRDCVCTAGVARADVPIPRAARLQIVPARARAHRGAPPWPAAAACADAQLRGDDKPPSGLRRSAGKREPGPRPGRHCAASHGRRPGYGRRGRRDRLSQLDECGADVLDAGLSRVHGCLPSNTPIQVRSSQQITRLLCLRYLPGAFRIP